jgi:hypothetical protein
MKKALLAVIAAVSFGAQAADFVSIDVDHVTDSKTKQVSTAEYVRAGKEIGGVQLGLQSRTARYNDGSGMYNSLELTAGKNFGGLTPYVGWGYDNGKNGLPSSQYNYGIVGAQYGTNVGPGFALAGVKHRVNVNSVNPDQTVAYLGYSVPVTKQVSLNLNASRSYLDIAEKAYGLGLSVKF